MAEYPEIATTQIELARILNRSQPRINQHTKKAQSQRKVSNNHFPRRASAHHKSQQELQDHKQKSHGRTPFPARQMFDEPGKSKEPRKSGHKTQEPMKQGQISGQRNL